MVTGDEAGEAGTLEDSLRLADGEPAAMDVRQRKRVEQAEVKM